MSNEYLLQKLDGLEARISDLYGQLNTKVDKGDVISQINISDEGVKIHADKILVDGETLHH